MRRLWLRGLSGSILFVSLVAVALAGPAAEEARLKQGRRVDVTLRDGRVLIGELVLVKDDALTLQTLRPAAVRLVAVAVKDIAYIKVDYPSRALSGALWLGVPFTAAGAILGGYGGELPFGQMLTLCGGLTGLILGGLNGLDDFVDFRGRTGAPLEAYLTRLRTLARFKETAGRKIVLGEDEVERVAPGAPSPEVERRTFWRRLRLYYLPGPIQAKNRSGLGDPIYRGTDHFRVEYSFGPSVALGLEYISLGKNYFLDRYDLSRDVAGNPGYASVDERDDFSGWALMAGVSLRTEPDYFLNPISLSFSAGAGIARADNDQSLTGLFQAAYFEARSQKLARLAWHVTAGADYFIRRPVSIGLGVGYYSLPIELPALNRDISIIYRIPATGSSVRLPGTLERGMFRAGPDGLMLQVRLGLHF